jgi:hypothetical protein
MVIVVVVVVIVIIVIVGVIVIVSACSHVWGMVHLGCVWSGWHANSAMKIYVTYQHYASLVGPASNWTNQQ